MTDPDDLTRRNAQFLQEGFRADLTISLSGNMIVIGCVDPREDPKLRPWRRWVWFTT